MTVGLTHFLSETYEKEKHTDIVSIDPSDNSPLLYIHKSHHQQLLYLICVYEHGIILTFARTYVLHPLLLWHRITILGIFANHFHRLIHQLSWDDDNYQNQIIRSAGQI